MALVTRMISGWGRYPIQQCELERPERYAQLRPASLSLIARGQGRSYGDASLNEHGRVLLTERVNRMLDFDANLGILRAEAGVILADILDVTVPKGWFLPVTPGTRFVSLGGCVAADVHGKNHHQDGSFGDYVLSLELILADGNRIICSPDQSPALFWATIGGMGLTGIIGEVTIKLMQVKSSDVMVNNLPVGNLDHLFEVLEEPTNDDRYSVAWIDTTAGKGDLGRAIAMRGHHVDPPNPNEEPIGTSGRNKVHAIPFDFPSVAMSKPSISAFNGIYYKWAARKREPFVTDYNSFFYPLDAIGNMNRIYGKRGFVQYQCVVPSPLAFEGIRKLLEEISSSRLPSFLAVLKRLGPQGRGLLSFPTAGYTLALDMPIRGQELFDLLDRLDLIVLECGGRVYLAKDARLSVDSFRAMYPRLEEFLDVKCSVDPQNRFSSSLSKRLGIGGSN